MSENARVSPFLHLFLALFPIAVLITLLYINVQYYKGDSSYGSNQVALLVSALLAGGIGLFLGKPWKKLYAGIVESIGSAMGAIIILLLIGALAGTWLISGVVPAMIFYGLKLLSPTIFLFAACLICAFVSLATGSSWSTIATVGVALIGIGQALGFEPGLAAGAVISGAYFGDKMSPLSDTTNLAPAVAGTDLFTHIRHMVWTTVPSISIALIIFLVMGFSEQRDFDASTVEALTRTIDATFNINPFLFLVPGLVIFLIIKKVDAIPAIFIGSIAGAVFAFIFQKDLLMGMYVETNSYMEVCYKALVQSMSSDTSIVTGMPEADKLLSSRGMNGMLNTIWLIICALTFGGVMQASGFLKVITNGILSLVNSSWALISSTAFTCVFFNVTASDQYLAIVVPGKMFARAYRDKGLKPENLSRTLEDSGTVTSVLIPWNTCGVAQSTVLGIGVLAFAPFCFFNIISPIMTVLFAIFDYKVSKYSDEEMAEFAREDAELAALEAKELKLS